MLMNAGGGTLADDEPPQLLNEAKTGLNFDSSSMLCGIISGASIDLLVKGLLAGVALYTATKFYGCWDGIRDGITIEPLYSKIEFEAWCNG